MANMSIYFKTASEKKKFWERLDRLHNITSIPKGIIVTKALLKYEEEEATNEAERRG